MDVLEKIMEDLKENLSNARYLHSLRVAEVARRLARIYDYDQNRAYLAGVVHDIAKEYDNDANGILIKKYNLSSELLKKEYHRILHSEIGALVARDRYGLDEEICHAIYSHTIGDLEMSLLDKIIFVADKIEPAKSYEGIEEERLVAYEDITKAVVLCIKNNHKKLKAENKKIYPKSLMILEKLESEVK